MDGLQIAVVLLQKIQNSLRRHCSGFIFKEHTLVIVGIPICFHLPAGHRESLEVPKVFQVYPN